MLMLSTATDQKKITLKENTNCTAPMNVTKVTRVTGMTSERSCTHLHLNRQRFEIYKTHLYNFCKTVRA